MRLRNNLLLCLFIGAFVLTMASISHSTMSSFVKVKLIPLSTILEEVDISTINNNLPDDAQGVKIYSGHFSFFQGRNEFLIFRLRSSYNCGAKSCATLIYETGKDGYKLISQIVTNGDIYQKVCGDRAAILFTEVEGGVTGVSEWAYVNGKFEFQKKYLSLSEVSQCE